MTKITDAEFTVVRGAHPLHRRWWQGWRVNWLVVASSGTIGALGLLAGRH